VARIQRQHEQGIEAFKRALATRGALQSGELSHGLAPGRLGKGQAEYELGNNFANAAQGVVNDYLGVEGGVRSGEAAAINAAQANVFANPENRPVDAYDAPLVEGSVEQYGQPLYKGKDGKLYTLAGQPFGGAPDAPDPATPNVGDQGAGMIWVRDENGQLRAGACRTRLPRLAGRPCVTPDPELEALVRRDAVAS